MATNDYFMRQIEGFTDMLSTILFDRKAESDNGTVYHAPTTAAGHSLLTDLRLLVALGRLNEAENLLFERMEEDKSASYLETARVFYSWLDAMTEGELAKGGFSRGEIEDGMREAERFYRG